MSKINCKNAGNEEKNRWPSSIYCIIPQKIVSGYNFQMPNLMPLEKVQSLTSNAFIVNESEEED